MKNFIPKPYRKEPITIRIDVDKLQRVEELARKYNVTRSEFINRCIDFSLENMPEQDKEQS